MAKEPIKVDGRLRHMAFIMDGNGRWAQKRGLPRSVGHKYGARAFKRVIEYCGEIGVEYVTVYAFSPENWSRPREEIDSIMKLLDDYLDECEKTADDYDIKIRFIGDLSPFEESFTSKIRRIESKTANRTRVLNVALNYGGRSEIVHACNKLIAEGKTAVSEADLARALYTADVPDPDLIVRTAGERRLSNFLLWQAAYSEFYYTDTLWPDMSKKDVDAAVEDFYKRKRRYGKV